MDAWIGMIALWPVAWAPLGWAFCQGQLLQIAEHQALYALIGIQFGGNGTTTFALPDLRGRAPVGIGQGPGLEDVPLAQQADQNASGDDGMGQLGMDFIICLDTGGYFPPRY
ncbi:MAG: tail fiber protein [Phycisphaerae bacterium]|nr:tail fiber protein [Phycisphaerae bacterium]